VYEFEFQLNRFITKADSGIKPKYVPSDTVVEKGVEMFYEIVFYAIALSRQIYKYNKSNHLMLDK
jgi:hypothetical protein